MSVYLRDKFQVSSITLTSFRLVKQKLAFSEKCKNMSTKQEIVSDATFKAWPFSSDIDFACKDGRVSTATSICFKPYHYQLL